VVPELLVSSAPLKMWAAYISGKVASQNGLTTAILSN
jgi:hypothetical protein